MVAAEVEEAVDEEEEAAAAGEEGEGEEEELSRRAGRHLLLQRAVRAWQRRPPAPPCDPMPALTGGASPSQADEAVELLQVPGGGWHGFYLTPCLTLAMIPNPNVEYPNPNPNPLTLTLTL